MIKRVGFTGMAVVVVLALSGLAAQGASAAACYKISEYKAKVKGGAYTEAACKTVAPILEGEYALVNLLKKTEGNLWCAEQTTFLNEDGYYKNGECKEKLLPAESNKSVFTEVEVLPDISLTLGGAYPLHLNYESSTVKSKLETVGGTVAHGEGLKVLYLIGELTALGTFRSIFKKVESGTEKCFNTGAEANGEVLTEGSFHIVYTSLFGSTQGLHLGILYLPKEFEFTCPTSGLKIKVKGSVIGTLNLGTTTETSQLTGWKGTLNGTAGKQEFRAYWNDQGTALLAQLLSNTSGAGFKESNQVVEGEPEATALEGKMFVITNR